MWMYNCVLRNNKYIGYCSKAGAYERVPCSLEDYFIRRCSLARAHILNTLYFLINFTTVWYNGVVSVFFYLYVIMDFFTSIIGVTVLFTLMTVALAMAAKMSLWVAWLINLAPLIVYECACLIKKPYTQVRI